MKHMNKEGRGETIINPEPTNDDLLRQLDALVVQDTQRHIHTRVVRETIDKSPVEPGERPLHLLTDEGYLVTASSERENNKHVIVQNTRRGRKMIVLSPPTAPGTETDEQMETYLQLIHYDPVEKRFTGDFLLKPQMLTHGLVTTDLPGFIHREEMLLAVSGKRQDITLRTALKDAVFYSKRRLAQRTGQGTPGTIPPPALPPSQ